MEKNNEFVIGLIDGSIVQWHFKFVEELSSGQVLSLRKIENVMKQNLMGGDDEIPKKKVMDTKPPKSTKADGKTEAKEEGKDSSSSSGAKKELKNLLELQLKLMSGVSNLQPILKEVQGAVSNLKTQQFLNE